MRDFPFSDHSFFPKVGIILNIEEDHLDFFKDLDDIRNSFHEFAKLLPAGGTLVINGDIPHVEQITDSLSCEVAAPVRAGHRNGSFRPVPLSQKKDGQIHHK